MTYAQHINLNNTAILEWIEANPAPEEFSTSDYESVVDYLRHKDFAEIKSWASWELLLKKTHKWHKLLSQNVATIDEEYGTDIQIVLDFQDGFKWVKLISQNAYTREGNLMSHCVGSYFDRDVEIFSLRDSFNKPHCTVEKDQQIKGKGNGDIHPKYIDYVVQSLEYTGMQIRDSEMQNLGYYVPEFVEYVVSPLYKERYAVKDSVIRYSNDVDIFENLDTLIQSKTSKKILLRGNLNLRDNTQDLDFSNLKSIGGYLYLETNTQKLDFSNLETIGDYLYLRDNTQDLDFSNLKSIGGYLDLEGNTGKIINKHNLFI